MSSCGSGSAPHPQQRTATLLDGVWVATTTEADLARSPAAADAWGRWTLALAGRRFALTRENALGCAWAYGGVTVKDQRMEWRVIDAGGSAGAATDDPADIFRFRWTRYRDILRLTAIAGASARPVAAEPWRWVSDAPRVAALGDRCRPPGTALIPTDVEDVTPGRATVSFGGDLVRSAAATWRGHAASKELGPGTLTIEGSVALGELTRSRLTFTMRLAAGVVRGCAINTIFRRPHGRYVWDGVAQITATSSRLRRYLGLAGGIGGVTKTASRNRVHGGFGFGLGTRGRHGPPRPDVVC